MFYNPEFDTIAEYLPTCCSEINPPRYHPNYYGNYIIGIYAPFFLRERD